MIWNNALITSLSSMSFKALRHDKAQWGRLVENAVGAHILNHSIPGLNVYYWRHRQAEVDFVLEYGTKKLLLEVTTGLSHGFKGFEEFKRKHGKHKSLLIGPGGIELEDFFLSHPTEWF